MLFGAPTQTKNTVDVIANAFSNSTPADANKGIYDIDTEVFGPPFDIDNNPHIFLFILNIRDAYYYDSSVGVYTGGYHSAWNSQIGKHSNQCEMFYLDANPGDLLSEAGLADANATIAHEFQHMIQAAAHQLKGGGALDQETFYDEGCSETASVICGYPGRNSQYYLNETNIKLGTWRDGDDDAASDVLHDYERAFRFMLYGYEQYGSELLTAFTTATNATGTPLIGKTAFVKALNGMSTPLTFPQYLEDWFLASVIDDASVDPKWNFNEGIIKKVPGDIINPGSTGSYDIAAGGAQVLTVSTGSNITVNFTTPNPYAPSYVTVKAIKDFGSTMEVVDVELNTDIAFTDFGTAYSKIQFVIYSTAENSAFEVQYSVTGTGGGPVGPTELSYDENAPLGSFNDVRNGDQAAVEFGGVAGTRLKSVKVALRNDGDIDARVYKYTGTVADPLGDPLCDKFTVTGITTPDDPYPDPWTNWVEIDMSSQGISTENDFIISFEYTGGNKVMVTSKDGKNYSHSISYDSREQSWVYYVSNDNDITYLYMIRAVVESTSATGVEEEEIIPVYYKLSQNYPNPFNPTTNISYTIPESGNVSLRIYDVLGKLVNTLVDNEVSSGSHQITWNGKDANGVSVASGMYFYTIKANNFIQTKKMMLIK